ncbi:hypothetical protein Kpol_1059p32 [Vanderwaltozyma polyspora DSM 70294]|uniref:Uncharacterized protein n=1 Tax=Vanderwaltozyma polyspora (strain ATCC 22028 / DSM 70294 / BCRC 21397 / CBS 2163 / NBRC 10782 / NRRL Y-8283 / UCD 57-17) TaxID=436907 RepID=A7TN36_VANPO|nr:uncharacterized protein Kpol_1059p32 [Vanderwaltozyma polyspora DSM 70294]EDO16342.1 hypothetical protein Kpol_1059p32 [Vanderwaltozyma polyspora DSM 70294]
MFRQIIDSTILGLFITKAYASDYFVTLSTNDTNLALESGALDANSLVVHIDKTSMTPEILEQLASVPNIVFADLPGLPQFVNLKEYATGESEVDKLIRDIIKQEQIDLSKIKEDERYLEIENIVSEILADSAENYSDEFAYVYGKYKNDTDNCEDERISFAGEHLSKVPETTVSNLDVSTTTVAVKSVSPVTSVPKVEHITGSKSEEIVPVTNNDLSQVATSVSSLGVISSLETVLGDVSTSELKPLTETSSLNVLETDLITATSLQPLQTTVVKEDAPVATSVILTSVVNEEVPSVTTSTTIVPIEQDISSISEIVKSFDKSQTLKDVISTKVSEPVEKHIPTPELPKPIRNGTSNCTDGGYDDDNYNDDDDDDYDDNDNNEKEGCDGGYDNSSNYFMVPSTMFIGFLVTLLLFLHP